MNTFAKGLEREAVRHALKCLETVNVDKLTDGQAHSNNNDAQVRAQAKMKETDSVIGQQPPSLPVLNNILSIIHTYMYLSISS